MAYNSGFFTGQVGALIRLDTEDTEVLLGAATVKEIYCELPRSKEIVVWSATLDGTKLTYTTSSAEDLPKSGDYKLQAHLEGVGWSLEGEIVTMTVGNPLK